MIIDMSDWLKAERQPPTAEGATLDGSAPQRPPAAEAKKADLEPQSFGACRHMRMTIDDVQRTVKCSDCKMWLDPVWCLRELFRYYEQRIDQRLDAIKAFEERQRQKDERRAERKLKPRKAKAASMQRHLERAAWNEYQSKVLAARAATQRALAGKIEGALAEADKP